MQFVSPLGVFASSIPRMKRVAAMFAVSGLMAHATAQVGSAPWYQGAFAGTFPSPGATEAFSLRCSAAGKCELQVSAQAEQGAARTERIPTKVAVPLAAMLPNNNLEFTRRALLNNPAHAQDPRYRLLLDQLRPILAVESSFADCVDISQEAPGYAALCSLASDPRANSQLVLLLSTLNPSCGKQLFCAYYFIPLQRVESGR